MNKICILCKKGKFFLKIEHFTIIFIKFNKNEKNIYVILLF
jgi:hypothetical protein